MNFCINCKHCVKVSAYPYDYDFYCRKPCDIRYDYITGRAITHTSSECVDVRKNNPDCLYFEQKPPKWYKILFKKL